MTGKQLIDAYAGGDIGTKTPQEAYDLLEKLAAKSYTRHTSRARSQRQGVHQVDGITSLAAQVEALSTKIDQMHVHKAQSLCAFCGGVHPTSACHVGDQGAHEQGQSSQFRPQQGQFQGQGSSSGPPPAPEGKSSLEDMVARLLANSESQNQLAEKQNRYMEERFHTHETELRNQKASIQTIENQAGQIVKLLSERQPGGLPSNTEPNPNAHVKAITLTSGRDTGPDPQVPVHESSEEEVVIEIPDETPPRGKSVSTSRPREPVRDYTPAIPYPGRLKKQKMEEQYGKFLGLCKQLHINLPFVEALAQMPKYARFLKDILTNKRKLEELSQVTLNEECSAVIQNKLPEKRRDPRSFTIPCLIGSLSVSNALADLGASINLMSYAVFAKLELGEPTPTRMSIQLADRSVKGETFDPVGEDQFDEQLHSQVSYEFPQCSAVFAMVDRESEPIERPSIEDPPPVELKELPSHLEYAFLDGEATGGAKAAQAGNCMEDYEH
ncbi:hypothetical protein L1987_13353 [Smallanthus sonchifolius]|uniref:Uncharacterized protein n=1 Tax=Smallanthus sonchifolius TaxID=185202 RepID=A0ACB9JIL8_9ASTR|nr:hypothetical protein L1987_13353 [Smallanthus sonchifolius]